MRRLRCLAVLALIGLVSACPKPASFQNARVDPLTVRQLLKNYVMAMAAATEQNAGAVITNPVTKKLMGNNTLPAIPTSQITGPLDPKDSILASGFAKLFDSPFASELFNDSNVLNRTDDEIIYIIQRNICDQSLDMGDIELSDAKISQCKAFLEQNQLQLRVRHIDNGILEVALMFKERSGPDTDDPQVLMSFTASNNQLRLSTQLEMVNRFLQAHKKVAKDHPDNDATDTLSKLINSEDPLFHQLKGSISLMIGFKDNQEGSGCPNQEKICLEFNVDEDIEAELAVQPIKFSWAASPIAQPTLLASLNAADDVDISLNSGALQFSVESGPAASVDAIQATLRLPIGTPPDVANIIVSNFSLGNKPANAQFMGSTFSMDVTSKKGRVIESMQLMADTTSIVAAINPFSILFSVQSNLDPQCITKETLTLSTDPAQNDGQLSIAWKSNLVDAVQLAMSKMPKAKDDDFENTCTAGEKLLFYTVLQNLKVIDQCETDDVVNDGALAVKSGGVIGQYDYELTGQTPGTVKLIANQNQCFVTQSSV